MWSDKRLKKQAVVYLKEYVRMGMAGKEEKGVCVRGGQHKEEVQAQWQQPPQWLPE